MTLGSDAAHYAAMTPNHHECKKGFQRACASKPHLIKSLTRKYITLQRLLQTLQTNTARALNQIESGNNASCSATAPGLCCRPWRVCQVRRSLMPGRHGHKKGAPGAQYCSNE